MDQDTQHLNLLSIFYYVVAGFAAFFACIPFIHLVVGIVMLAGGFPAEEGGEKIPEFVGWIFVSIASLIIVMGWTLAVLLLITGRFLSKRKNYTFCFVIAAISCLFMPFGTILGVFTIVVLSRPSVKQMFGNV
jgi:hypothetical protein